MSGNHAADDVNQYREDKKISLLINTLELLPGNYWLKNLKGRYISCNSNLINFLGFKNHDCVIGKTDYELPWNQYADKLVAHDQEVINTGNVKTYIELAKSQTGELLYFFVVKGALRNEQGRICGTVGHCVNIVHQDIIKEELIQKTKESLNDRNYSVSRLNTLIEILPGNYWSKNKEGVYLGCNRYLIKTLNLPSIDFVIGKNDYELPWSDLADKMLENDEWVMRTGKIRTDIEKVRTSDGRVIYFLVTKAPLYDDKRNIQGTIATSFDITEQKQLEADLKQRNKELKIEKSKAEAANKVKTEFIANMSHDIRTPLTGVISLSELMLTNKSLLTTEHAEIIHESGQRLLLMLNQILDILNADDPEALGTAQDFSVHQLIDSLNSMFLAAAIAKNIEIKQNISQNIPPLLHDHAPAIHRCLLNLIGNAVKFTKQGEIVISAHLEDEDEEQKTLVIAVADTGVGIPEEAQTRIFDRFERVRPHYQDDSPGAGLGLSIVKKFLDKLGGTVSIDSKVGKGSKFTCYFPVTDAMGDSVSSNYEDKSEVFIEDTARQKALYGEVPVLSSKNDNIQLKLLLVEDSNVAAKVAKLVLEQLGCIVDWIANGEDALEMVAKHNYDLVFMDIGLPGISGFEATKKIHELHPSLPVVVLTGHATIGDDTCREVGLAGVLNKPISVESAKEILNKQFQRKRRIKEKELPQDITIDLKLGAKLAGGSMETAKEMLQLLVEQLPDDRYKIKTLIEKGKFKQLLFEVHRLKGATAYCGVPNLQRILRQLNDTLESTNDIRAAESLFNKFHDEVDLVLTEWKKF